LKNYKIIKQEFVTGYNPVIIVLTTFDNENFTSFPAEVGNPNYDAFLEQAQLTDKQVHSLKPDVWYDFPE
jgi:ABC-type oligopeptide transport system substrate-binding subunit